MQPILHITSRDAWEQARTQGAYRPDSLQSDGFIHFSASDQVIRTANTFFRGQRGLLLLVVDPHKLAVELRWEPPVHPATGESEPGSEKFPHLYGPLNLDAVARVLDFAPDATGLFALSTESVTIP